VRQALEPAFERLGPDATPEQVLDLKVCDPAMGSGAFLVEACRALAAAAGRGLGALTRRSGRSFPRTRTRNCTPAAWSRSAASTASTRTRSRPISPAVAVACHACARPRIHLPRSRAEIGDSLVGLTRAQIAAAHWDTSKPGLPLFRQLVKRSSVARRCRAAPKSRTAPDDTPRAIQEQRHCSLEVRLKEIRLMGDAVIAAFFAEDKPKAREKKRAEVESWLGGSPVAWDKLAAMAATLKEGVHPLAPFHWEVEFPEVFAREYGGFDAIVGNPPFLGGQKLSNALSPRYLDYLKISIPGTQRMTDLVAYFFRRSFSVLRKQGAMGLIATNTIAQGDTRSGGLTCIRHSGGQIYSAVKRIPWPGDAAVTISVVHCCNGDAGLQPRLDGHDVPTITAYLYSKGGDDSPHRLSESSNMAFSGGLVYGPGFLFADNDPASTSTRVLETLLEREPRYAARVKKYLGGDDMLSDPRHQSHRYVIDLNGFTEAEAWQWPELMKILETKVKPDRMALKDSHDARRYKQNWWKWGRTSIALDVARSGLVRVLAHPFTATHMAFCFVEATTVVGAPHIVIALDSEATFCTLQSRVHEAWARTQASSMEDRLRYAPSDCFQTYPFPQGFKAAPNLEKEGKSYYEFRAAIMVTRDEGMTKTYNRFHDPNETAEDIQRLRELHIAMDRAVLEAYGWHDLAPHAAPVFLDETNEDDHTYQGRLFWPSDFRDEVLARLLALNAERHAEEARLGIAPGMKGMAQEADADDLDEDSNET
jgi:truncated hemoglobin YjbI